MSNENKEEFKVKQIVQVKNPQSWIDQGAAEWSQQKYEFVEYKENIVVVKVANGMGANIKLEYPKDQVRLYQKKDKSK